MRKWKLFTVIWISALLLSACGTNDATKEQVNENSAAEQNLQDKTNTKNSSSENDTSSSDDELIRLMEQNLTYSINGKKIEETAFLTNSDNQGYSMYVFPQFELTSEEPMKDILYLKEHDDVFMRIELLSEETDWTAEESNIKTQLKAVSNHVEEAKEDFLKADQSAAFQASNEEEIMTAVLFKNEKNPLKVTMFTKKGLDYRQAFMEMAKTIERNQ
jgi:hypothetical protein